MSTTGHTPAPERRTGEPASIVDSDRRVEIDTPTLVTVSALAWIAADVFHELAGDWEDLAEGLDNAGLWAAGVVAAGLVVAIAGYRLPLRLFMPDLRHHPGLRHKIFLVPLATIVVVQTLSVAFSPFATAPPESNHLLGSVFAYAHLAVWAAGGLVIVMVFIAVLGPGIGPLEDHPLLGSS